MICEFCGKDIEEGKAVCWDLNWLYAAQDPDQEVPREKMDLHSFCSIEHLEDWQKKEGYYDDAKAKSIKRSGTVPQMGLAQDKKHISQDLHHRGFKGHGRVGSH